MPAALSNRPGMLFFSLLISILFAKKKIISAKRKFLSAKRRHAMNSMPAALSDRPGTLFLLLSAKTQNTSTMRVKFYLICLLQFYLKYLLSDIMNINFTYLEDIPTLKSLQQIGIFSKHPKCKSFGGKKGECFDEMRFLTVQIHCLFLVSWSRMLFVLDFNIVAVQEMIYFWLI